MAIYLSHGGSSLLAVRSGAVVLLIEIRLAMREVDEHLEERDKHRNEGPAEKEVDEPQDGLAEVELVCPETTEKKG